MKLIRRLLAWWAARPETLMALINRPRPASTSKLYVVEIDFAISPPMMEDLQRNLDMLRSKFGLEFFISEPGIRLKRFDDF
jgi:hypothetical protein